MGESQKDSEASYRLLFEAESNAIAIVDGETLQIIDANPAVERLYGYTRAELLGMKAPDLSEQPQETEKHIGLVASGEPEAVSPVIVERIHRRKDGTTFPVEISSGFFEVKGRKKICAIIRDVTERKRAEEELRAKEQFLSNVFSSIQDGISILDRDLNIIQVNQTMREWYRHQQPLEGKKCYQAYHLADSACEVCPTRRTLATKEVAREVVPKVGPQGKRVGWIDLYSFPLFDSSTGELAGVIEYVRDITEQKRLEEQLLVSQKMEAIGRLVGGIAHDFNNLLNVITGYSDVILYDLEEEHPARGNIYEISRAAQKAADLTKQLLAFSRKRVLKTSVLDMNEIVQGTEKMLRRLIGEDIELRIKMSSDLVRFRGDPGLIEQVIMNLAVNARDAMPEGGKLIIETSSMELDQKYMAQEGAVESGAYVMLAVTDTGAGMEREVRDRIFEPFFTTKATGKGTGLGLSTVYGIVRQSSGYVLVYTTPGHGTTFKIYFPRVEEEVEQDVLPEPTALRGSETILVVEDEELIRGLVCKILDMFGYQVLAAESSSRAPELCKEHKGDIHLMVTDVVMPEVSGRELADQLSEIRPDMKVLYMSGYADDAMVHHGILEEGIAFLQKPFSANTLAAKVREVLDS